MHRTLHRDAPLCFKGVIDLFARHRTSTTVQQVAAELQGEDSSVDEGADASAKKAGALCTHPLGESFQEHAALRLATDGHEL